MITGYAKIRCLVEDEYNYLTEEIGISTTDEEYTDDKSFQFLVSQLEILKNDGTITEEQRQDILKIVNDDTKDLKAAYLEVIDFCIEKE